MSFRTTLWDRISAAKRQEPVAVDEFVTRYRSPLLRYISKWGFSAEDSEDILQEIFLQLFGNKGIVNVDKAKGRFRNYLIGIAQNVIKNELTRRNAKKRGGGRQPVALEKLGPLPTLVNHEDFFEQAWMENILSQTLSVLREENPRQHDILRLRSQEELSYKAIGAKFGLSVTKVKNDLQRARKRMGILIKDHISWWAFTPEDCEDDMTAFSAFLGG